MQYMFGNDPRFANILANSRTSPYAKKAMNEICRILDEYEVVAEKEGHLRLWVGKDTTARYENLLLNAPGALEQARGAVTRMYAELAYQEVERVFRDYRDWEDKEEDRRKRESDAEQITDEQVREMDDETFIALLTQLGSLLRWHRRDRHPSIEEDRAERTVRSFAHFSVSDVPTNIHVLRSKNGHMYVVFEFEGDEC